MSRQGPMNRRSFVELLKASSATYLVLRVTGCGPLFNSNSASASKATAASDARAVQVYNLVMQAWSTLGSGRLGDTGYLPAGVIRDFEEVTYAYTQDDHGHQFTLGPEQFSALLRGEPTSVITTIAQGHNHEVRIDPTEHYDEDPLTVYVDANGKPVDPNQMQPLPSSSPSAAPSAAPQPQPPQVQSPAPSQPSPSPSAGPQQPAPTTDKLYSRLDEGPEPYLYVDGTTELQEDSVQFCFDSVERCNADASLWHPLQRYAPRTDKQIFRSQATLGLDKVTSNDLPLMIKAKTKTGGQLLNLLLKLSRLH